MVRSRSMLDVSYAGSPLVGEYPAGTRTPMTPLPATATRTGPRWTGPAITCFSSAAPTDAGIGRLRRRWRGLVDISDAVGDPRRAGLAAAGAVLVRPDGHIGFRAPADSAGLGALDSHLDSYLIPTNVQDLTKPSATGGAPKPSPTRTNQRPVQRGSDCGAPAPPLPS